MTKNIILRRICKILIGKTQILVCQQCPVGAKRKKEIQSGRQEFGRCRTRGESGESISRRQESMQVRNLPWLWNPGQMSETGVSVAPQKGLISSKKNLKQNLKRESLANIKNTTRSLTKYELN